VLSPAESKIVDDRIRERSRGGGLVTGVGALSLCAFCRQAGLQNLRP
jgi:hypothetical protein